MDGHHVALLGLASELVGCLRGMAEAFECNGQRQMHDALMDMHARQSARLDSIAAAMLGEPPSRYTGGVTDDEEAEDGR